MNYAKSLRFRVDADETMGKGKLIEDPNFWREVPASYDSAHIHYGLPN